MYETVTRGLSAAGVSGKVLGVTRFADPWGVIFGAEASEDMSDQPAVDAGSTYLHLVTEGVCYLRAGGHHAETLEAGDVVVVPGDVPHILSNHPEGRALPLPRALDRNAALLQTHRGHATGLASLHYTQAAPADPALFAGMPELLILPTGDPDLPDALSLLVRLIQSELASSADRQLLSRVMEPLLAQAIAAWLTLADTDPAPSWLRVVHDPVLCKALARMFEAPGAQWSVTILAATTGLSRAAFSRRFAEAAGETPMAFLNRCRLAQAGRQVAARTASIEDCARTHGYSNAAAFSRAFRRLFGYAPSQLKAPRKLRPSPLPATPAPQAPQPPVDAALPPSFMADAVERF
ncbi:AraC family transcriptional regulator [Pseudaestuariivita sp.]|uniref:AraC family transcriptional regulator n=1 Tax=Pseudaestuariivita sp. TaxID=2211669 RepID=UPI0040597600